MLTLEIIWHQIRKNNDGKGQNKIKQGRRQITAFLRPGTFCEKTEANQRGQQ
jgi:hypothetical protein